jgi:hypothetical protein
VKREKERAGAMDQLKEWEWEGPGSNISFKDITPIT